MTNPPTPSSADAAAAPRVLLVDDHAANLEVLLQTLDGRGYELLVATNGADALRVAAKARPAVVLLDIMMPELDGYEVCRRLKANPATRDSAVLFLSALDEAGDKVHGFDVGAVDYIAKPFHADEVVARVDTHLTIRQLQRDLSDRNTELRQVNDRLRRDLDAAMRLQSSLVPAPPALTPRAQFAWEYRPCAELAGDTFNVLHVDDRYVCLYIADVSGQGVSAALLSLTVARSLSLRTNPSSLITELDGSGKVVAVDPSVVASQLNATYPMSDETRQYFTLVYGVLDTQTGIFKFVCAGHPGPIRVRPDGTVEVFDAPSFPIGMMPNTTYTDTTIEMAPGDRLYLYSDGVTDEANAAGATFGRGQLTATLVDGRRLSLDQSVRASGKAVALWRGHDRVSDDLTILAAELGAG